MIKPSVNPPLYDVSKLFGVVGNGNGTIFLSKDKVPSEAVEPVTNIVFSTSSYTMLKALSSAEPANKVLYNKESPKGLIFAIKPSAPPPGNCLKEKGVTGNA